MLNESMEKAVKAMSSIVQEDGLADQLARVQAKMYRKLFNALILEGFSRKEATQIVAHSDMAFRINNA